MFSPQWASCVGLLDNYNISYNYNYNYNYNL